MPDGRLFRTVVVKGDSADIFSGSFPVPSDSTWEITTRREPRKSKDAADPNKDVIYVYEARKEFTDYEDLNFEFSKDSAFHDHISIMVNVDKKLKWFCTHFYYTETYGALFPFHAAPVSEYLTDAELKVFIADDDEIYYSAAQDSILFVEDTLNLPVLSRADSGRFRALRDSIEQKLQAWQRINIYTEFYEAVTLALRNLGDTSGKESARQPLFLWLDKEKTIETGIEYDDAFLDAAAAYFGLSPEKLRSANPAGFETFSRKFRVATYSLESYTNCVQLPGRIVRTNAKKTRESEASWTFRIENFYATDYTMRVESKRLNLWMATGTGILLVLLTVLLFGYFRHKK